MNSNMTGFRWFSKIFVFLVLWAKVASALEGLKLVYLEILNPLPEPRNASNGVVSLYI